MILTQTTPEAARLLRPVTGWWATIGARTLEEPGRPNSFQLRYGELIRVFGENGLVVESLLELLPPADAVSSYRDERDRYWSRRWPMENIRRVRRAGG